MRYKKGKKIRRRQDTNKDERTRMFALDRKRKNQVKKYETEKGADSR